MILNPRKLAAIVRLRYKLIWAKTRFRNGRIALFTLGCFLLAVLLVLSGSGGIGAGIIAIKSKKAELVAQAVLGGLYVEALLGAVLTGFGLNTVFTDAQLRLYPVTALERRVTRHFIAVADPFWFLILALEIGFAICLYIVGNFNLFVAIVAILLLFLSNYLLARILSLEIDRLFSCNAGYVFLVLLILLITFLASAFVPHMGSNPDYVAAWLQLLHWTPPFAAADCIVRHGVTVIHGFGLLAVWTLGLAAVLTYIERLPSRAISVHNAQFQWDSPLDRLARLCGRNGSLIVFWFRSHSRNSRLRAMYALSLPVTAFLTFSFGNGMSKLQVPPEPIAADNMFLVALGAVFVVSFLAMSRFAVNQFGYSGGAFRRFLLFPVAPKDIMQAGSIASILVGGSLIPAALMLWIVFGGAFDARKLIMLFGSAVTGLFVQHAAGLWVTPLGPRKVSYTSAAGNDMSVMGNLVVMGCAACGLYAPHALARHLPAVVSPKNWWLALPLAGVGIAFYLLSLRTTGAMVARKRERLLAVIEGRVR